MSPFVSGVRLFTKLSEHQDCCLILYHPYRPLVLYMQDLREQKDGKDHSKEKDEILNVAWTTINDTYRTDIPLLYPPHLIAIGVYHMKKSFVLILTTHCFDCSMYAFSLCRSV